MFDKLLKYYHIYRKIYKYDKIYDIKIKKYKETRNVNKIFKIKNNLCTTRIFCDHHYTAIAYNVLSSSLIIIPRPTITILNKSSERVILFILFVMP